METNALTSIFGNLTQVTQLRFDALAEQGKKLFDNTYFDKYMDWDAPSIGLDFEELIGQYNISVAAPTVGDNSKEAMLGVDNLMLLKDRVLNHAISIPMPIQKYRQILQLLDSKSISDDAKREQLVNMMWGDVNTAIGSVLGKLDMIFLGALSNEGKFTLDETNNPEGGVKGTISFNQPAANIAQANTQWNSGNLANVDCLDDIQSVIDAAQDKVQFSKILCAPSLISYICRSDKVRRAMFGDAGSARMVQLSDLNLLMEQNGYPTFEPIRRQVRIQNGAAKTPYSPWNAKNMVFVPEGKLGIVKNAWANNELKPEAGVQYSNYGRIRISQWGVGETQGSASVEFTKAECQALPVITEMNGIYTLKTEY